MLRYLRPPRASIQPLKVLRPPHVARFTRATNANIQRVKITQSRRLRSLLAGLCITFACYSVYNSVVLSPLARYLELEFPDDRETRSAEDGDRNKNRAEEDDDEDLEPLFIPMPFTTTQIDPEPYAGNSPEWQEFIRLSKDKALMKKIRSDLATIVRTVAEDSIMLNIRTGKGMTVRRWWLDVDFPYKPPPEFTRSGFEVHDEGVDWITKPVDAKTVSMVDRILWPSPVAISMWNFSSTLFKQNVANAMKMIGVEPKVQPSPAPMNPMIQKAVERIQQSTTKNPDASKGPDALAKRQMADGDPPAPPSAEGGASASATGKRPPGSSSLDSDRAPTVKDLIPHRALLENTRNPLKEFKKKFGETWRRPGGEWPPRGCILVSGFVELDTPKAWVVIDVFGWWDPKTRKYDNRSLRMGLRRMQVKQQVARR